MNNKQVFSPFRYFGGKQQKVKHILPYFPVHNVYVEPFFGGGALFFAKKSAEINVINDIKKDVINFLNVLKDKESFDLLIHKLTYTTYSLDSMQEAKKIIDNYNISSVDFAWAFFVLQQLSFMGLAVNNLCYGKDNNRPLAFQNKIANIHTYIDKIKSAYIFNKDALDVIREFDKKTSFFYCDPPYIETTQSSYLYYDVKEYKKLLQILSTLKGKFLLSGYDNEYANSFGFNKTTFTTSKVSNKGQTESVECLWSNYPLINRTI